MARGQDTQWRQARDWLYSTGRLVQHCPELLNLGMSLTDGVVLCEVANDLHPGAIKSLYARPHIKFQCVKNIDNFLNSCVRFFSFQAIDLFTATELVELENFGRVIEVLSKLSRTIQATSRGLAPFYVNYEDQEIYTTLERDAESRSEDIYSRIDDHLPFNHTHNFSGYSQDTYDHEQESIYEDIVKIKEYRMAKPKDKQGYMIDEIFETEKNYVRVLEIVILHFVNELKPILTGQDIKVIFQNIEELKRVHEKLLQRLKLSIDNGGNTIGDCFVKTVDQLYTYGNYCAKLDNATQKIDELMSESKIANKVNRCLQESNQKFALKDLIKVPAQRILKYHLLLNNLLKVNPENVGLQNGSRVMKALATYINEYKRNYEQMETSKLIEERIQNKEFDLFTYGRLLKDGEVMLKNNNKSVKRFAFLFERCILICKKSEHSNLEIHIALDFESYDLAEQFDPPGGGKFSFGWSMKNKVDILETPYSIMVKTSDQCANWMTKLQEGFSLLRSPSHLRLEHTLSLKDFKSPQIFTCSHCTERLSGVFAQGLSCTVCNLVCHRKCKQHLPDCKIKIRANRGSAGYPTPGALLHKDLPMLPSTAQAYNSVDHHVMAVDGPSSSTVSPPPIPPRAPSIKAENFYSISYPNSPSLERRSMPHTPPYHSRSPSFDRISSTSSPQHVTIQGDLYVCTKDYNGGRISEVFEPSIALNKGEFVEVLKKDHPIYWKGMSQASNSIGYFPSDCVKIYSHTRTDSAGSGPFTPLTPKQTNGQLLKNFPWFVGEMDRNGGRMMLEPATVPDGCYLVRESKNRVGQYSIDVKFSFLVKHIKVVYSDETKTFCLAPSKTFGSIIELVTHYQHNTLGLVFRDLQTKLVVPYRCLPGS